MSHLRKNKALSALLCLCLIIGLAQAALAAENLTSVGEHSISLPPGSGEFHVPLALNTAKGPFAGIQFSLELSGELSFEGYDRTGTVVASASPVQTEKNGLIYIGIFAGSNSFELPESGRVALGELIFKYSSASPVKVTLSDVKVVRLGSNNVTTTSEAFTNPGTKVPFKFTYAISRGSEGDGDGEGTGVPITPGVTTTPDGISTTPVIEIGTPLGGLILPFINGYPDGTVRPNGSLTRAELSQIIYNLYYEGNDISPAEYTDVASEHWAFNAISYCQEEGYMIGYPDGSFGPSRMLTRAELSTVLVRIKDIPLTSEFPFPDVGGHWAEEYIGAAYTAGFILGYPDGTFRANNVVTRAEAVTMICRAEGRDVTLYNTDKTFPDLYSSFWGYDAVMHAANGYSPAA